MRKKPSRKSTPYSLVGRCLEEKLRVSPVSRYPQDALRFGKNDPVRTPTEARRARGRANRERSTSTDGGPFEHPIRPENYGPAVR